MTVLVWVLPALAVAAGWALRARSVRRRLTAALAVIGYLDYSLARLQAERDHVAWEHGQERRLRLLSEADRDASRWIAADHLRQIKALQARPPVIVGTVAVDGAAAYAAALEAVDGMLDQMGVGE